MNSPKLGREVSTDSAEGRRGGRGGDDGGGGGGGKLSFAEEMAAKLKRRQESHDSSEVLAQVASPTLRRKPPPAVTRNVAAPPADRSQVLVRAPAASENDAAARGQPALSGEAFDALKESVMTAVRSKLDDFTKLLLADVDARIEAHRPGANAADC